MARTLTVSAPGELLASLQAAWPEVKRTQLKRWLKFQAIAVNGRAVSQFNHPLRPGDVVAVQVDGTAGSRTVLPSGLTIVHEDESLIVVDKPPGLLSMATEAERERTAHALLTEYLRDGRVRSRDRIFIVHRLDRETSGLMVFARTPEIKGALQQNWDSFEKGYEAVVEGRLRPLEGTFDSYLDETNPYRVVSAPAGGDRRRAITHYRTLASAKGRSLVTLSLVTGRRHQIRVHVSDAGCPVVGDKKYGAKSDPARRLGLHAVSLKFRHPVSGEELQFISPLPKPLARLVDDRPPNPHAAPGATGDRREGESAGPVAGSRPDGSGKRSRRQRPA